MYSHASSPIVILTCAGDSGCLLAIESGELKVNKSDSETRISVSWDALRGWN